MVDIGLHQTAALPLCLVLVAICTPLIRGTRERDSVGINFAVRYCCYRNPDCSSSVEYELLPVSRTLILENHHDQRLGRNTAHHTTSSGARYRDNSRGARNTGRLYATAVRFAFSLKMRCNLILRGISPTCGSECVRMVIWISHQLLAKAVSVFGLR